MVFGEAKSENLEGLEYFNSFFWSRRVFFVFNAQVPDSPSVPFPPLFSFTDGPFGQRANPWPLPSTTRGPSKTDSSFFFARTSPPLPGIL